MSKYTKDTKNYNRSERYLRDNDAVQQQVGNSNVNNAQNNNTEKDCHCNDKKCWNKNCRCHGDSNKHCR